MKPTDLEAAILRDSPVFGLRPIRAARFLTSKVPNPMIWTFLSFFTPLAIESRTASRACSAARLVASAPRAFWMDSMSSALFMAKVFVLIASRLGKTKSSIFVRIFLNELLDFWTISDWRAFGGRGVGGGMPGLTEIELRLAGCT